MLYTFVKKSGNVIRIGDIDASSIEAKLSEYLANGYEIAEAAEYDAQVLNCATATSAPVMGEASSSTTSE